MRGVLPLLAALFALACAPTESGNPPVAFDGSKVDGHAADGFVETVVRIDGRSGAVEPAEGEVYLATFGMPLEAASVNVEPDRSFGGLTNGSTGEVVRAFVRTDDGISAAIDWRLESEELVPEQPLECLQVVRTAEFEADGTASIAIGNECDGDIELEVSATSGTDVVAPSSIASGDEGLVVFTGSLPTDGFSIGTVAVAVRGGVTGTLRLSVLGRAP